MSQNVCVWGGTFHVNILISMYIKIVIIYRILSLRYTVAFFILLGVIRFNGAPLVDGKRKQNGSRRTDGL